MKPPLYDLAQVLQKEAVAPIGHSSLHYLKLSLLLTPCIDDPFTVSVRVLLPLPHDALEAILVPLDRLRLVDAVRGANPRFTASALSDTLTWASPVFIVSHATIDIKSNYR